MYRVLRNIYCGISGKIDENSGKYKFKIDWDDNSDVDIVKFLEPYYFESRIQENVYWFGYKFTNNAVGKYRDDFIQYLKNVQVESDSDDEWAEVDYDGNSITEPELEGMIVRSLNNIDIFKRDIDTVVYPVSYTNNLVKVISKWVGNYIDPSGNINYVQIKKSDTHKIHFNIDRCLSSVKNGQLPNYITRDYLEDLENKIHNQESFSLRRDVPMKLRNYVQNILDISDVSSSIEGSNSVLIIDDFKTSGTTIRNMIDIVRKYNKHCVIYIFTLIGKK